MFKKILFVLILVLSIPMIVFASDSSENESNALENVANMTDDTVKHFISIGVGVCAIFFVTSFIILNFATALNHPEYRKWGYSTLTLTIISFAVIKFVPIIIYRL